MMTMEIVAEFLGIDADKGAWEYFCNHWQNLFIMLFSESYFEKYATNLWNLAQQIRDERDSVWDLINGARGMLIADKSENPPLQFELLIKA